MSFAPPFVLLDDARAGDAAPARLYTDPVEIVVTRKPGDVPRALAALKTATRGGLHAAGFVSYEMGFAVERKLAALPPVALDVPLLWFGLFRDYEEIAAADMPARLPDATGGWLGAPVPDIDEAAYTRKLDIVREMIAAGDLYQANLTFRATVETMGHPLALYAGLRARSASGYGAVVATGTQWLLSLSPELFFSVKGRTIRTRPMKGTAARAADPLDDAHAAAELRTDPKQRAENLMIVDLLRNDLSRVAAPGSVEVPELYHVETYPTLHQMTSTVEAQLADDHDAVDALATLFPCGSITGAPKIIAMAAIRNVEDSPRGAYTGAIGRLDPDGDAAFNVAIRTLVMDDGGSSAKLGLGSGIVADSVASAEWRECLAKGAFVASDRDFDLIETMRFDPMEGIVRLERHLLRMKASAASFGFAFDRHAARNELQAATFRLRDAGRVRLMLASSGRMAVEVRPLPPLPEGPVAVTVARLPVASDDFRLRHKTTNRRFYDDARNGAFETIFALPDGRVTEGSFTNIFVERDGSLLTPPLAMGLMGGMLRNELIDQGRAFESELRVDDLVQGFSIGNSLRGLLPARLTGL